MTTIVKYLDLDSERRPSFSYSYNSMIAGYNKSTMMMMMMMNDSNNSMIVSDNSMTK